MHAQAQFLVGRLKKVNFVADKSRFLVLFFPRSRRRKKGKKGIRNNFFVSVFPQHFLALLIIVKAEKVILKFLPVFVILSTGAFPLLFSSFTASFCSFSRQC